MREVDRPDAPQPLGDLLPRKADEKSPPPPTPTSNPNVVIDPDGKFRTVPKLMDFTKVTFLDWCGGAESWGHEAASA